MTHKANRKAKKSAVKKETFVYCSFFYTKTINFTDVEMRIFIY